MGSFANNKRIGAATEPFSGDKNMPQPSASEIHDRIVQVYISVSPGGSLPQENGQGDLDSMGFLEFIIGIEREFGIKIEVSDLDETNFISTDSTASFVQRKLSGVAA
jgi:acyl carrier protein